MVFSGIPFLFWFLPAVLIIYFAVPKKFKNAALLLGSLVFYTWGASEFVLVMLASITQGYVFGLLIERTRSKGRLPKIFMAASCILSVGVLVYCKYVNFFIDNINSLFGGAIPLIKITLPIGISFYTFQILSYTVDVYKGRVPAQHCYIDLAAYIAMFPQLIAGPIVRYSDIAQQLRGREHTAEKCASGIRRFIIGLGKKILIANVLGELCEAFRVSGDLSVLYHWLYAISYMLHIYYDFSGYSDMAIGLGRIFGFELIENFNYPYTAKSITGFWRRWHISLGSWFRDYVYIPLGGNRVSKPRWFFNIMIVWMLTGFWHGAAWNFIFWGLFFGILLYLEKLFVGGLLDKIGGLSRVYVLFAVMISFIIFDAQSMSSAFSVICGLFSGTLVSAESIYYLKSYSHVIVIACIGAAPFLRDYTARLRSNEAAAKVLNILEPLFLAAVMTLSVAYIVDGSFSPFLYFRF